MKETTVKTIVEDYLKRNKYDGLCHPDIECGCGIDDLVPCVYNCENCQPAYKRDEGYFLKK